MFKLMRVIASAGLLYYFGREVMGQGVSPHPLAFEVLLISMGVFLWS